MQLVVETAFSALSVALVDGDLIVAEHHVIVGRGHAETLMPAIAAVVGDRAPPITAILVDTGPGSFTGLRVGIAAARALGLAWDVPVTGIGSLCLIAAGAFAAETDVDTLTVAVDAGRGQIYLQRFRRDGLVEFGPAEAVTSQVLLPPGAVVTGSGAGLLAGDLDRRGFDFPRAADARLVPRARRCLPPVPLYLRAPDAAAA